MRQATQTEHLLEMLIPPDTMWIPAQGLDRDYNRAALLAHYGRLVEAIEEAERITVERWGHMRGMAFRCVTKTTTVTVAGGPWEHTEL